LGRSSNLVISPRDLDETGVVLIIICIERDATNECSNVFQHLVLFGFNAAKFRMSRQPNASG
jgi:hypothetical protein